MVNINKDNVNRRLFSGWGSISVVDRQNDYIDVLTEFRDRGIMEIFMARGAPVIDSHSNHPVGRIVAFEYKTAPSGQPGLYLTAEIFSNYETDHKTWQAILDKQYTGFSLGGRATDKTPVCDQERGCYNNLTGIENWEWSIVETPANQEALIDSVNKLAKGIKVQKARVYVKYPADAPQGSHVYTGEKGGKYYETEEIGNKSKREQIEREQKAPKMDVKSLQDVVGNDSYAHMETFKEGRELKDLLETYAKISSGKATDQDINRNFQFIQTNLPKIYQMYYFEGREDEVLAPDMVYALEHRKIAENIKKLINEFAQAKDRKDKTIAIDNFIGTAHTSGLDIIATLWLELWDTGREFSFIERTAKQYMDYLRGVVNTESEKKPPQIKVKSLEDVIGNESYNRMDKWREGRELKDLLNVYTKISTGTANDEEINRSFDFIDKRLPEVYNFYAWAARNLTDKDTVMRLPEFRAEHKEVADNVKKVQNIFAQVKDRKDKVIAIDNFMNTSHTSGDNIVARLWNAWRNVEEKHDPDFVWVSDIPDKYMDYLRSNIGKALVKAIPIQKYIRQCGDKFCVYSEAGKKLGTHPTKEDAHKQLYAIEINKYVTYRGGLLIDHDTEESVAPDGSRKPLTAKEHAEMVRTEEKLDNKKVQKAKIYVKQPSDAPPSVRLQEGKHGGHYYESLPSNISPITSEQNNNKINNLLSQSEKIEDVSELSKIGQLLASEVSQGRIKELKLYTDTQSNLGHFAQGVVFVEPNTYKSSTLAWKPAPMGEDPILNGQYLESKRKVPQMIETAIHEGFHQRFTNDAQRGHEAINKLKNINYGGDEFEGLIRLATFYIIAPEQLKNESPEQYKIVHDWLNESNIQKAKVYVKNPAEAPPGAKLQEGKHGGHYYETEASQTKPEAPKENQSDIIEPQKIQTYDELKATPYYKGSTEIYNDITKLSDKYDVFDMNAARILVSANDLPTDIGNKVIECSESFKYSSLKSDKPVIKFLGKTYIREFNWKDREGKDHTSTYGGCADYVSNEIHIYDDYEMAGIIHHEVGHFVYKQMMSSVDAIPDPSIKGIADIDSVDDYRKMVEILKTHKVLISSENIEKILDDINYARELGLMVDMHTNALTYYDKGYGALYGILHRLKENRDLNITLFEEKQWKKYRMLMKQEFKSNTLRNEWLDIWQTEGYQSKEYANRNNGETFAEFYQTVDRILRYSDDAKRASLTQLAANHPLKWSFFKKYVVRKWLK